ncbi:MAG: hypothetical protein ABIF22_01935 [bacterium]
MDRKIYGILTGVIFLVVAPFHLLRSILGWQANISTLVIPIWISWIGLIVASCLAYQGLRNK